MNVANALEAEFSLAEQERIEKRPTSSPTAYALYLLARDSYLTARFGEPPESFHQSLDRAIELDSEFAFAYALKAISYARSMTRSPRRTEESQFAEREEFALRDAEQALKWCVVEPMRGGRVNGVVGHPTNKAVFYAGDTGGGVWKTPDGSNNWINISDV